MGVRIDRPVRIGAVSYLNSRPLIAALPELAPRAEIVVDLPSRLAEGLEAERLDVALVPSIEVFRCPRYRVVSDACIACHGCVRSVKLFGRVRPEEIRTLALDEGSRTSAALARILLRERFGLEPSVERLPIGATLDQTAADAVVLIGDRAILSGEERAEFVWDLGEQWVQWTGLPFVFALWLARPGVDLARLDELFAAARDRGVQQFEEIAAVESPRVGITYQQCLAYFRDHLVFTLGKRERLGLEMFGQLARKHGLAPSGVDLVGHDHPIA